MMHPSDNVSLHLTLPSMPSTWQNMQDRNFIVTQHHKWRATSLAVGCTEGLCTRCTKDVDVVLEWFPSPAVTHTFILATAAWFTVVCEFDDRIEELYDAGEENEAYLVLEWAIREFSDLPRNLSTKHTFGGCGSRVQTVILFMKHRLQQLYPNEDLTAIYAAIRETLQGHQGEIELLKSSSSFNLDRYLLVRCRTIAVAPILAILALRTSFIPSAILTPLSSDSGIISRVAFTAGLQNDLIGLERDLVSSDKQATLNAVVVLARCKGVKISQAECAIIILHNIAVSALMEDVEKERGSLIAITMAGFCTGHAIWAARSNRYKVSRT